MISKGLFNITYGSALIRTRGRQARHQIVDNLGHYGNINTDRKSLHDLFILLLLLDNRKIDDRARRDLFRHSGLYKSCFKQFYIDFNRWAEFQGFYGMA